MIFKQSFMKLLSDLFSCEHNIFFFIFIIMVSRIHKNTTAAELIGTYFGIKTTARMAEKPLPILLNVNASSNPPTRKEAVSPVLVASAFLAFPYAHYAFNLGREI